MTNEAVVAGLSETVQALRAELTSAITSGRSDPLRFQIAAIELELALAVTREGGADGGVQLGVVSIGIQGGASAQRTHRLKLTLQPVLLEESGQISEALISGRLASPAE